MCIYIYVYTHTEGVPSCGPNSWMAFPGSHAVHQRLRMELLALGHELLLHRPQQRVEEGHLQAPQHGGRLVRTAEEWWVHRV